MWYYIIRDLKSVSIDVCECKIFSGEVMQQHQQQQQQQRQQHISVLTE